MGGGAHYSSRMPNHSPTSPRIPGIRSLHSPGPTRLPEAVLQAMQLPMMDLGDPRVNALVAECEAGLRGLLKASADTHILLYAANGHGMWECTSANLSEPGRTLLIAGGGHFSDSWAMQAEVLGQLTGTAVQRTACVERCPIDAAAIEQALREDHAGRINAVLVVHTDTASGITSDLAAIRRAIDACGHGALLVVDLVASLAAEDFDMQALGVDAAMGASQKGLMGPPGLGWMAVTPRALAYAKHSAAPRFYWDWVLRATDLQYRKFCGTPPLAHLQALRAALGLIDHEGLPQVLARHARLARAVHAAVTAWGDVGAGRSSSVRLWCPQASARANGVTAIDVLQPGLDPEALRHHARERYQVAVAGGLGQLNGRVFRIGHLGDMNEAMVLGALAGVQAALLDLGAVIGQGGVAAAIQALRTPSKSV